MVTVYPVEFVTAFDRLMLVEKGYVNDPNDPGGETNWGISKRSYPHLDIKNLTREQAMEVYFRDFWQLLSDAHPAVKFQAFDFAVNSGIQTSLRKLQQAIGVADDGHWGPRSAEALAAAPLNDTLMRFAGLRLRFLTDLRNWPSAGRGWARRISDNLLYAAVDN